MTMQDNIDIIRRSFRRDVDEPKLQTFTLKIDNQRPILIPIAIAADNRERRTDCLEIKRDCRLANITQMPNLNRGRGEIENCLGQFIVSIGKNENLHLAEIPNTKSQIPGKLQYSKVKSFAAREPFRIWTLSLRICLGFGASGALPPLQPSVNSYRVI